MAPAPRPFDPAPDPRSARPRPRSSAVLARLTLSALERGSDQPGFWSEPEVHRAVLVSGLSVLLQALQVLEADGA
ncbi:MAG: hypothetical protein VKJ66_09250 [Synechococcus sp.]|nr:hypothetical protein [Synechococcus sp.]